MVAAHLEGAGAPSAHATVASAIVEPLLVASWSIEGSPVIADEQQLIRLLISNPTEAVQTGSVTVLLPPFLERLNVSQMSPGASCSANCYPNTTVSWALEDLRPGATQTLWLRPTTGRNLPNGTLLQYEAKVSALGGNPQWLRTVTRAQNRALNLNLSADQSPVGPGKALTYSVLYSNWSADPIEPAQLRFEVPAGTSHESGQAVVTFDLGRLRPGTGGQISIPVQVDEATPHATHLLARVTLEEADRSHSELWASHRTVVAETVLGASLEMADATLMPQELQPVRLTLTNPTAEVQTVDVVMMLPQQIDRVADYNLTGGECGSNCYAGDTVRWRLEDVPPGASRTLFVRPTISRNVPAGTLLAYRVALQPLGADMHWVEASGRVDNARALNLDVVADAQTAGPAQEVSYTLNYANWGQDPIDPGKLILNLPAGTSHEEGTPLEFDLGRIAPGAGGVQQVTVMVNDEVAEGDQLLATAELREDGIAHASTNASAWTTVSNFSLDASLRVDPVELDQQELHEISLAVSNPGTEIENANVTLWLPLGIDRVQSTNLSDGAVCQGNCYAGSAISWSIEDLGPGQTRTVWARAIVARNAADGQLLSYRAQVAPLGSSPSWLRATARVAP